MKLMMMLSHVASIHGLKHRTVGDAFGFTNEMIELYVHCFPLTSLRVNRLQQEQRVLGID